MDGNLRWGVVVSPEDQSGLCRVVLIILPASERYAPPILRVRPDQVETVVRVIFDVMRKCCEDFNAEAQELKCV